MRQCDTNPTVELLIPVYKPGKELTELLEIIEKQNYPLQRVHLLVTASEKEFAKIREKYERQGLNLCFTRIAPENFDHGGTRHLGASQSQADILLCMTQDAVPADNELLENDIKGRRETPLEI